MALLTGSAGALLVLLWRGRAISRTTGGVLTFIFAANIVFVFA